MSTRREFLKTLAATFLTTSGAPILLEGCAGGLVSYHTQVKGDVLIVPRQEALSLSKPNGIMMIRAPGLNGPIVLRNVENQEIVALSIICTHRGCEVRPMPRSFECPCHGSEYDIHGNVIQGPARLALKRFPVEESPESFIIKVS
jgi:Rieske Fe-S protein